MREAWVAHEILKAWGTSPLVKLLRANTGVGWFVSGKPARKTDPGAYPVKFGTPGQGDYTGLIAPSGRRLELETKTANRRQSEDQILFQRFIESMGGLYVLARSLEDFDLAMAAIGVFR